MTSKSKYVNLIGENENIDIDINKRKILNTVNYMLIVLFLFLVGFNIFFIQETKEINKELNLIKNNTNIINIPYDIFDVDINYTIIGIDVIFMLSVIILSIGIILCKNFSRYCIPFIVILYFLIPSMQINYIFNTINLKKYINEDMKTYIISSGLYISTYILYTIGLTVNFFKTKI